MSQLGVVGTSLFLVFAGMAVAVALGLRRRADAITGGVAAVCLTTFAYWLLHGSVDWFWEMPTLAAPAFGLLGLATSTSAANDDPPAEPESVDRPLRGGSRDRRSACR